ncbi:MAG: ATP-NAD kinase family protein [Candidatus Marinimicrobia bacterium]|nr:ATP-NAD kinase family protein [Candidatus Neomarinimicrobiota bacterium]
MTSGATIGLLINPIAGMGGRVGLKGTDGPEILARARELGAMPMAGDRALQAMRELVDKAGDLQIKCPAGEMGEAVVGTLGIAPQLISHSESDFTTSADTIRSARHMADADVDLLLFVGGDGTARDIVTAIGNDLPVLGIPAGVKIHSAVYAKTPLAAAKLAGRFLNSNSRSCREAEVLDIDEENYRNGRLNTRLYGYLKVPLDRRWTQGLKAGSPIGDQAEQQGIADAVIANLEQDCCYIIGPGSTTAAILNRLDLPKTLLGVDLLYNRQLVEQDLNEAELLMAIAGKKTKIIVTPIGGQGFIFGRGNQQISPTVLRQVGRDNLQIIATRRKILELEGRSLLIDTGNAELDRVLAGYYKIITGFNDRIVYKAE